MTKYCIFIKQLHVHNKFMKLADVVDIFVQNGLQNVKSILSSGNIIFTSNNARNEILNTIKTALDNRYQYNIDVFIKDIDEIKDIINNNIYENKKGYYLQTFICDSGIENILIKEFNKITPLENEQATINNNKFYWYYDKSTRWNSKFLQVISRERLKHLFTLRTLSTMIKVANALDEVVEKTNKK